VKTHLIPASDAAVRGIFWKERHALPLIILRDFQARSSRPFCFAIERHGERGFELAIVAASTQAAPRGSDSGQTGNKLASFRNSRGAQSGSERAAKGASTLAAQWRSLAVPVGDRARERMPWGKYGDVRPLAKCQRHQRQARGEVVRASIDTLP